MAVIHSREAICAMLDCLGMPTRAPPIAPTEAEAESDEVDPDLDPEDGPAGRPARTLKGSSSRESIPGICSGSSASNSDSKKLTKRPFPDAERGGGTRRSRRGGRLFHLAARTRKPVDALAGPTAAGYANAPCEASDRKASQEHEGDALTQTTIRAACAFSLAVSLERRQSYE